MNVFINDKVVLYVSRKNKNGYKYLYINKDSKEFVIFNKSNMTDILVSETHKNIASKKFNEIIEAHKNMRYFQKQSIRECI